MSPTKDASGAVDGAIGGAVSAGLNPVLDGSKDVPPAIEAALTVLASSVIAETLGKNAQGAATAAENETLNNWLNHVPSSPAALSEQQQYDNAAAACSSTNADACNLATSSQRDVLLANACSSGNSALCNSEITEAEADGNLVSVASNGIVTATDPSASTITAVPNSYLGSFEAQAALSLQDGIQLAPSFFSGVSLTQQIASWFASEGILETGLASGETSTIGNGLGAAANDASFSVPKGYTQNVDGTVTGPQGATYSPTGALDENGNQIFQSGSGGYFTLTANGASVSAAPSTLAGQTASGILAANSAAHNAAVTGVSDVLQAGGASVQTEVTMNTTVNGVTITSRADMVITAPSGATNLPVPISYAATDVAGNPITSIPVNSNGQVVLEIKTGNGQMTSNQLIVYPLVQTGNATGTGANAVNASVAGSIAPTPVVILRKL